MLKISKKLISVILFVVLLSCVILDFVLDVSFLGVSAIVFIGVLKFLNWFLNNTKE